MASSGSPKLKFAGIQPSRGNPNTQKQAPVIEKVWKSKADFDGFLWFSPLFFCFHLQEPLIAKYLKKKKSLYQSRAESALLGASHLANTVTRKLQTASASSGDLPVTGCLRTSLVLKEDRCREAELTYTDEDKTQTAQEGFLIRMTFYALLIPKPPHVYQSKLGTLTPGDYLYSGWGEALFSLPHSFLSFR